MKTGSAFTRFSHRTSTLSGRPSAFLVALSSIVLWAVTGPMFGFSDTWQLVVNTGSSIVTFLMVFLIQNSQNRDTAALQIKLDEVVRSIEGAHNALLDLEELDEADLERIRARYKKIARQARLNLEPIVEDVADE